MVSTKAIYQELVSTTKLFLLREFELTKEISLEKNLCENLKRNLKAFTPFPQASKQLPPIVHTEKKEPVPIKTVIPTIASQAPEPEIKKNTEPTFVATKVDIEPKQKKQIELEPLPKSIPQAMDPHFKNFFQEHFAELLAVNPIPCDRLAKSLSEGWLEKNTLQPIVILYFKENLQSLPFLKNLARAISLRFAKVTLIDGDKMEKDSHWDKVLNSTTLKFVITSDYEFYSQPQLQKNHQQNNGTHFLNQIPLFLMTNLSLYTTKPELKSILWSALCKQLSLHLRDV